MYLRKKVLQIVRKRNINVQEEVRFEPTLNEGIEFHNNGENELTVTTGFRIIDLSIISSVINNVYCAPNYSK